MTTLTAVNELMYERFLVSRVLVIAPKRVAEDTWTTEAEKWDHLNHLKISRVLGSQKERAAALQQEADIYVINRENVVWLVEKYRKSWPFDMVVVDELSSFKSNQAKRFKALKQVRPLVERFVGLTGTPSPNGLLDLWPQMYLIDRGERLGKTITGYRNRYFYPEKSNGYVVYSYAPKPGAEEAIQQKISDICVSMKAEDYLQMPELESVFWDNAETVLGNSIRNAVEKRFPFIAVRPARKERINDRINCTVRLMGAGRFYMTDDCESLEKAFSDAVWDKTVTDKDERLDDGSTDVDSLDAFEYTIERDIKYLIM